MHISVIIIVTSISAMPALLDFITNTLFGKPSSPVDYLKNALLAHAISIVCQQDVESRKIPPVHADYFNYLVSGSPADIYISRYLNSPDKVMTFFNDYLSKLDDSDENDASSVIEHPDVVNATLIPQEPIAIEQKD